MTESTTMTLAAGAAVVGLLLISAALYKTHPQKWLFRWNLAWLAYLLHLLLSYLTFHQSPHALSVLVPGTLFLASQSGIALSMLSLAWKPEWERRLLAAGGTAILLYVVLSSWLERYWLTEILFGIVGLTSVLLAWSYARSRRRLGGWLLLAALLLRSFHSHRLGLLDVATLEAVDLVTAVFALAAGLAVMVEEMQEQVQWRSAGAAIAASLSSGSARMASGGGAELCDESLRADFHRMVRATFCRLLLAAQPEFQRLISWIPNPSAPGAVVLRTMTELEQASVLLDAGRLSGLALVPLRGSTRALGLLAVGYDHPVLGSPADLQIMDEVGLQVGMALEGAQLLETVSHAHQEWMDTVNSLADLVLVHDRDGRIERVNQALAGRLGRTQEQLVGRLCREVFPGAAERWKTCPFCEAPAPAGYYDPDLRGHFLVSTSLQGVAGGRLHIVRDISERRMAEERYQYIIENVREGVFISTPEGRLLDCNEALARLLGYTREELLGLHLPADVWVNAEDRKRQQEMIDRQDYLEDYEVHLRRRDGREVVALETSFASRDESGRVIRYQGFLLDITERIKAEAELRRHNEILTKVHDLTERLMHSLDKEQVLRSVVEELRALFEFDTVAVYVVEEGRLEATRAAATGYRSPLGQHFTRFAVSAENLAAIRQARGVIPVEELGALGPDIRAVQMAEGLQSVAILPLVGPSLLGVIAAANRRTRVLSLSEETLLGNIARQVRDALENALLYEHARRAYEDLREAQEKLLQSEKMAALGQLVSGVAHELNNPLAAIIGYAQLLASHVTGKGGDFVDKLLRQAQRTQKIIQDLLSFSRQRKPERVPLDINRVVEDVLLLREYEMRGVNIKVVRQYGTIPPVPADRAQLEQVCLNIVSNAMDALESQASGTLTVSTYLEEGPLPVFGSLRLGGPPPGHVVVEFSDDGPGVKEPARVFDPFYTTKKVGRGTGLGLSICYGIIKEHGGDIEVSSRQPHGAIFRVRLPMVAVAAEPATA